MLQVAHFLELDLMLLASAVKPSLLGSYAQASPSATGAAAGAEAETFLFPCSGPQPLPVHRSSSTLHMPAKLL
jgi:hypothetical protein